jgi:hypothetical protein
MSDRTVTIDLNAPVRLVDAPALAGRVLAWWLGELNALAPAWARRLFPDPALKRGDQGSCSAVSHVRVTGFKI